MHTGNDLEEELRSMERLKQMNADGILVLATSVTKRHQEVVERLEIPVLFLGQRVPYGNSVIYDDYRAGMDVGKYLGESGISDAVLLWVGEEDPSVGKERRAGVLDGFEAVCGPRSGGSRTTFSTVM